MNAIRMVRRNLVLCGALFFAVTLPAGPVFSQSALETDRMAGQCALYAIMADKERAAYAALSMASNQARAEQFMSQTLTEIKRLKDDGKWELLKVGQLAKYERGCRTLGIRVSDY